MQLLNADRAGTIRHSAEDDLFHFDRPSANRLPECDFGLFRAKVSARAWVTSGRPRWLLTGTLPLVRSRAEE